ncbi:MAG: HlyD family efflux transporter periplasmic adaptor subunit [Microcoleaceae cyanobacterium MO_207.B10]|nr:HlyD family efflux transporter periplasmic adaptor subunit [Microcoleaceae cyanobacterium MO_207.B10]
MPQLNSPEIIESNGHKKLDTDLVTLEKNTLSYHPPSPNLLTKTTKTSSADWSYATKELLDALPQRWTRGLLYFLVLFVTIVLPWSMLAKVDETGVARGRLEPQKGTLKQEVDFAETVKKVHIEEGDTVKAGDILIEFDSRQIQDKLQQLQIKLEGENNRLIQLEKQKGQLEIELQTQERQNQSQKLEKLAQIEQAKRNLQSLKTVYNIQKEEKLAQVHQAQQNLDALVRTSTLQQEEKLAQVHQAEQNMAALNNTLNLQKEEKLAQVSQGKQRVRDNQTALELSEIRWQKSLREVERYRNIWIEGVVSEVQVIERENISEERQRLLEQSQADLEQAKLRLQEQEENYDRVIHQAEADIKQAELRLEEQQGSYNRILHQSKSDIEQAELRLAEQKSSYERIIHQAASEIEQAELRLGEQENNYQTIIHAGEISISKIKEQLKNLAAQKTGLISEIAQTEKEIESLNFDLEKRTVRAKSNGTVFNLPVDNVGDVVQQGEMVVEIAPKDSFLLLKAEMATGESGSLKEGMPVKLKFDAYPFQDYGIVEASLSKISPTSEIQETNQGPVAAYELEIDLEQGCIPTKNECIVLRPGDTATAEVIVRQRRVIDFIIDPFKKLQKGGLEL